MKLACILLGLALLVPVVAFAQAPPINQLGVYADQSRSTSCASGVPPYPIDMWVYLDVGVNGADGYAFDLQFPANVQVLSMDLNRHEEPSECLPGQCPTGIWGSFSFCLSPDRNPSIWVVHASLNVTDAEMSTVSIIANPDIDEIRVMTCGGGQEVPVLLTQLYINYPAGAGECGPVAAQGVTWGTIKGLYQ